MPLHGKWLGPGALGRLPSGRASFGHRSGHRSKTACCLLFLASPRILQGRSFMAQRITTPKTKQGATTNKSLLRPAFNTHRRFAATQQIDKRHLLSQFPQALEVPKNLGRWGHGPSQVITKQPSLADKTLRCSGPLKLSLLLSKRGFTISIPRLLPSWQLDFFVGFFLVQFKHKTSRMSDRKIEHKVPLCWGN